MSPPAETTPPGPPEPLARLAAEVAAMPPRDRIERLIAWADEFTPARAEVAAPPYPEVSHVPRCESEVWVFATDRADRTLDFHFAVGSAHSLSAKAWASVLTRTCSGQPLERVAAIPEQLLYDVFGSGLTMGKGLGLAGMLDLVRHAARERLAARAHGALSSG